LLLIGQQGMGHFSGYRPLHRLARGLFKCYANAGGTVEYDRYSTSYSYCNTSIKPANPLLSVNNYTQLVIGRNVKNKQLTLLSQCKLALTEKNANGSVSSGDI
jgi:hypothetical protein